MSEAVLYFWTQETSGVLRPAVHAYLDGEALTPEQVAALRAYLRQWIDAPVWVGDGVPALRMAVGELVSRAAIEAWLRRALAIGILPL